MNGVWVVALVRLWITKVTILLGAETNTDRERTTELAEGQAGAEREIQMPPRDAPKEKERLRSE